MEVSTIEVDLNDETQDFLYKQMDIWAKRYCDKASYTIFKEALDDRRDVQDGATCLGHALLNSIFIEALILGMKKDGIDVSGFEED